MSRVCPHCRQEIAESREWRGLLLRDGKVYWRDARCDHLTPGVYNVLWTLARTGGASHLALAMNSASRKHLQVLMCRLRDWFAVNGIPLRVVNDFGHGYRLKMEETT